MIYPTPPNAKIKEAKEKMLQLLKKYPIDIIAIGNGTASRESEAFVAALIREYHLSVAYTIVSEAGASVYSASKLARRNLICMWSSALPFPLHAGSLIRYPS